MSALDRRHSAPPSRLEYSTSPPGAVLDPDPIYLTEGIACASPLPSRLALGGMGLSTDPPASDEGPIDCDSRA